MKPLENTVVNLTTQEEYDKCMKLFESFGWGWSSGIKPTAKNCWKNEKEETCVDVKDGFEYDSKKYHEKNGYKIISFKQLMDMQKKTFKTLEVGDFVKYDSEFRKVLAVIHRGNETEESVYVISCYGEKYSDGIYTSFDLEKYNFVIDQLEETEELTMDQVCQELGRTIKIKK